MKDKVRLVQIRTDRTGNIRGRAHKIQIVYCVRTLLAQAPFKNCFCARSCFQPHQRPMTADHQ